MRIRYILKCLIAYVSEWRIKKEVGVAPNEILIVHTDAIGDYILFRNFIAEIKESEKFKNHNITLCGNASYKDFAEHLDKNVINEFIWFDKKRLEKDFSYRKDFFNKLRDKKYSVAINPSYSRDFLQADSIIRQVNADKKIGQLSNNANTYFMFSKMSNNWYTDLIDCGPGVQFEFLRNKSFIERVINSETNCTQPHINSLPAKKTTKDYVLLFPGAGERMKMWPSINFAKLVNHIKSKGNTKILIAGSKSDYEVGDQIIKYSNYPDIVNLCGTTSLMDLLNLVNNAKILITNDSSALHMAACTQTPTICFAMGRHYGRFTPYPNGIAPNLHFLFPEKIKQMALNNVEKLHKLTTSTPIASINDIEVEAAIRAFDMLNK